MNLRRRVFQTQDSDDGGVVAVVEFLSAFTLFLMILTAFMSLAQLELGSNDPYTDMVDKAAIDGLERLTNGEGWFVPDNDGVRDYQNATADWHTIDASTLYYGSLQPGIITNGKINNEKVAALANVSLSNMITGLGLADDMQLRLVIKVESSPDSDRVGEIIFAGGSDRKSAGISSVASRMFTDQGEVVSINLEVHDGGNPPPVLRISEFSVRPADSGPEWIEVQNYNGFGLSLDGWSFQRTDSSGSMNVLLTEGVVPGGGIVLFSGDPNSQESGNASEVYNLGSSGFLGIGSIDGLSDTAGRLQMLHANRDEAAGTEICRIEWDPSTGIAVNSTFVWNGDAPTKSSSWELSNTPTPGEV